MYFNKIRKEEEMRTNFNTYKETTPNFGMAIRFDNKSLRILEKRFSYNDWVRLNNNIEMKEKNPKIDMYFSSNFGRTLKCDLKLGPNKIKTYKENPITALFKSPIEFIQKIADEKAEILK